MVAGLALQLLSLCASNKHPSTRMIYLRRWSQAAPVLAFHFSQCAIGFDGCG
jgi:hypothetical protein